MKRLKNDSEKELDRVHTELVLDASGIGKWKFNLVDNTLEWDDHMYKLYEMTREDFSGHIQAWEFSLHPDDKDKMNYEVEQAIKGVKDFDSTFRNITP